MMKLEQPQTRNIAYHAYNEDSQVLQAFGSSPAAALRVMADLMESNGIDYWDAIRCDSGFGEEPDSLTVYV